MTDDNDFELLDDDAPEDADAPDVEEAPEVPDDPVPEEPEEV